VIARVGVAGLAAAVSMAVAACGRSCEPLEIRRGDATLVTLCATRTRTEAELRSGLVGRPPLAPDEALVLVFPVEDELCITNAEVGFAIDAAFVDADGLVVAIERAVPAHDERSLCHGPTAEVVEASRGALDAVAPGDLVSGSP
jgi:uncharacterized membrane protein (UPF0127 family)